MQPSIRKKQTNSITSPSTTYLKFCSQFLPPSYDLNNTTATILESSQLVHDLQSIRNTIEHQNNQTSNVLSNLLAFSQAKNKNKHHHTNSTLKKIISNTKHTEYNDQRTQKNLRASEGENRTSLKMLKNADTCKRGIITHRKNKSLLKLVQTQKELVRKFCSKIR